MAAVDVKAWIKRAVIRYHKHAGVLFISDTTLRDGEQMPGVRLTPSHKLTIARQLARLGVHSIDAGFPACGPSEIEAIQLIAEEVHGPVISALARAAPGDIDAAAEALQRLFPHKKSVSIFLATSPIHREHKLRKTKADILRLVTDAIQHARRHFELISFSPEDASRTEPEFLVQVYERAIAAGATMVGFTDTVGILTPEKAAGFIQTIRTRVGNIGEALLGVHFHNDLGLATANALACVQAGVDAVQCTINGLGERAGNTALEELVMAITLHSDQYPVRLRIDRRRLAATSRLVSRLTGVPVGPTKPIVGANVFATEAGIHQDGLLKHLDTYLPFRPEQVGVEGGVRLVLGKHSGRHAVAHALREQGIVLSEERFGRVFTRFKQVCDCKAQVTVEDLLAVVRATE